MVLPIPLMNPISCRRLGLPQCYGWHRLLADQWITVANAGADKGANPGAKIMSPHLHDRLLLTAFQHRRRWRVFRRAHEVRVKRTLSDDVLPLIRTRAELLYRAANAHGTQMHGAVDILDEGHRASG